MRPERAAGGFARDDDAIEFYTRVNALLSPKTILVDFGAGRGRQFDVPDPGYAQVLQNFQGKVAKVIGVDVHEGILNHPHLDERHVVAPGDVLPIPTGTIDIVVADWVFEHLENPPEFVREMERILAPGGWICARTVNKWGYVGIGARLLPNRVHRSLVRRLIPVARAEDVFPTVYRLNSLRDIRRWFPQDTWEDCSYLTNPTPRYFANSRFLFRITELCQKIVPYSLHTDLLVFIRRR
jgi:SAM-dependent methyltransferase